jgi:hypothetical protein
VVGESRFSDMPAMVPRSVLTCPHCGHAKEESMPIDACQWFYECENCNAVLRPKATAACSAPTTRASVRPSRKMDRHVARVEHAAAGLTAEDLRRASVFRSTSDGSLPFSCRQHRGPPGEVDRFGLRRVWRGGCGRFGCARGDGRCVTCGVVGCPRCAVPGSCAARRAAVKGPASRPLTGCCSSRPGGHHHERRRARNGRSRGALRGRGPGASNSDGAYALGFAITLAAVPCASRRAASPELR